MPDQLLSILDEISKDGQQVSKTDEATQSDQESVTLEALIPLKTKLKDLSDKASAVHALETVKAQRTVDKKTALEVFTMLPGHGPFSSSKFTTGPSSHNRDYLLSSVSFDTNYASQYQDYIREIINVVQDKADKYDKLTRACGVYLETQSLLLPGLKDSGPRVVVSRNQIKLLDHPVEDLAYTNFDSSIEYPKYEGVLDTYYRDIVNSPGFETLKARKAIKSIKDGEAVGVTLNDICQYLSDAASYISQRTSEFEVIIANLQNLTDSVQTNPVIPTGYFEEIFGVLESLRENFELFYPENSLANAVLKLLKFLD